MLHLLSEIWRTTSFFLFVLCLLNLCLGCASSKQISIEHASWLASDNKKLIVHCNNAKYEIKKVKFEPNFLEGEIDDLKQKNKESINFYVTQFTRSDSSKHVIIYYDDIQEVREGYSNVKKNDLIIGSAGLLIVGIIIMLFTGVPVNY